MTKDEAQHQIALMRFQMRAIPNDTPACRNLEMLVQDYDNFVATGEASCPL
jgi:hypothetical protein